MNQEDALDRAVGDWLIEKETDPALLPGEFARRLPKELASLFLRELEQLAAIDGLTTQAPPRDLPLRYGDFRVLGELGRGAMGVVYDAEQVSTGRRVALKVLHARVAGDLRSASRFEREARTAKALGHPGIVPVLEFGETDGTSWLAMQKIQGSSLQRLLAAVADPRDMDHARALAAVGDRRCLARLLAAAADALEFAHRHNVVHRDVKPANLMVTQDQRMVVLDFGLATARDEEAPTLTQTGDFLGTPLYMAPEQAIGAENGTAQSDVYGLGAVLYECLAGQPPVAPGPLATVLDAILRRDPPDPRRLRADVPDELARIALQCLDKTPQRRYATAAALADDLRRFVDGAAVKARQSNPLRRAVRRLQKRPALVALLAGALLLVGVAGYVLSEARGRVLALQRDRDLGAIPDLLARSPERLTVFGGASLRHYARWGLGNELPSGSGGRSENAAAALQLAEQLVGRYPGEAAPLRTLAEALMDVGDDPERTDAVFELLLANLALRASDRAMAAVWHRQRGRDDVAGRLRASLPDGDVQVDYWLGFWHQAEQDHSAAIAAFTRALAGVDLPAERRYFALLHRGWCYSCPDVCDLRAAQNDLTQAAALRPAYGTAKLLWAALLCLDREPDLGRAVKAVGEVLEHAEPWLHVLTARVLQALAEGGTWQSGPVRFGAEFSPIAVLPIDSGRAAALARLSLQLLDAVLQKNPDSFEAAFHRIAGLALVGRHAEAVGLADQLLSTAPAARRAALRLQQARVHLAAGRSQRARQVVEQALAAAPDFVAAWRFLADVAAHVGDLSGELQAVSRAAALLAAAPHDGAVFPDANALLPELGLRRVRVLMRLLRTDDARLALQANLGGVLHGAASPRIRLQLEVLQRELAMPVTAATMPSYAAGSPLRWLADASAKRSDAEDAASALWRGWLVLDAAPVWPGVDELLQARGARAPRDIAAASPQALLSNAPSLLQDATLVEPLLERADQLRRSDPEDSEARLLRGVILLLTRQNRDAGEFLGESLPQFPDDLRARYVQADAALAGGDQSRLREALQRGAARLEAAELDGGSARLGLPKVTSGAAILAKLQ